MSWVVADLQNWTCAGLELWKMEKNLNEICFYLEMNDIIQKSPYSCIASQTLLSGGYMAAKPGFIHNEQLSLVQQLESVQYVCERHGIIQLLRTACSERKIRWWQQHGLDRKNKLIFFGCKYNVAREQPCEYRISGKKARGLESHLNCLADT